MTIKDIAQRCGVSVSTVSRVLNNHPDVSETVRSQVLEVVKAVHYVPNGSARDLVKTKSDAIGLVVRGVGNAFYTDVIQAIEAAVRQAGYTLVLHQIHSEDNELLAGAELARSKKLRGVILLGGRFDYDRESIAALGVPFVCCTFTNRFGALGEDDYASVSIDDRKEAYRAVELLIEHGHRRIAILLDSTTDSSIAELRYRGYCEALADHGIVLDPELVQETGDYEMDAAYAGTKRLLERTNFTAIFAIADTMAMAAIKALHEAGKRVPEDCSIIAIDGIPVSAYSIPTLTTLVQPREEMGREAARILLEMIEGRRGQRHMQLPTQLRTGGSVAAI